MKRDLSLKLLEDRKMIVEAVNEIEKRDNSIDKAIASTSVDAGAELAKIKKSKRKVSPSYFNSTNSNNAYY